MEPMIINAINKLKSVDGFREKTHERNEKKTSKQTQLMKTGIHADRTQIS